MYASIAAQRNAAPVYWYEPPGYPTGLWVLSKWEHQRYVGSHPELFSSRYGFAIGDASDPSTVVHHAAGMGARTRSATGTRARPRRGGSIARGKLSMGDPNFESLILVGPSPPRADPQHPDEGVAAEPGAEPQVAHRRDHRRVPRRDRARRRDRFRHDRRAHPGRVDDRADRRAARHARPLHRDGVGADGRDHHRSRTGIPPRSSGSSGSSRSSTPTATRCWPSGARAVATETTSSASSPGRSTTADRCPHGMAISFIHTFVNAGETTPGAPLVRGPGARRASRPAAPASSSSRS